MIPEQVAVGVKAGLEKMALVIQQHMAVEPQHVIIKFDFKNAYNTISRAETLRQLEASEELMDLAPLFWATHSPSSEIEGIRTRSAEGLRQGAPIASVAFCATIQPDIRWAREQLKATGGVVFFDMDDGYAIGKQAVTFRIAKELASRLEHRCGIEMQPTKSEAYRRDGNALERFLQEHQEYQYRTGRDREGNRGIKVAGIPMGTEEYINEAIASKVQQACETIKTMTQALLPKTAQGLTAMLVYCAQPLLNYEMRTVDPSITMPHLKKFDKALLQAAEQATGVSMEGPEATPYAAERLRLPKRMFGGGIRNQEQVAAAAYVGMLTEALHAMADVTIQVGTDNGILRKGLHPALGARLMGEDEDENKPYEHLIRRSNTEIGRRLEGLWAELQARVGNTSDTVLEQLAESAGTDGRGTKLDKMQKRLTEVLDDHNYECLEGKILAEGGEAQRHWMSLNRYSTQFVGSIPMGPRFAITNAQLRVAYEMYYNTKFKEGSHLTGKTIETGVRKGHHKMDEYGHNLTSTAGKDMTDIRHDGIKWCISDLMADAGLRFECEAFNLFAAHMRQRDEDGRAARSRQGLVPDFILYQRGAQARLMDVKTISRCESRYGGPIPETRALPVKRRQGAVTAEYRRKAREADVKYNGTIPGREGPIERQLSTYGRVHGLVAGAYGEMSSDVEDLVQLCAAASARNNWRSMGARNEKEAKAALVERARKRVGIEAVRGHAMLKLDRLRQETAGGDTRQARKRRRDSKRQYYERMLSYYNHFYGSRVKSRGTWFP
jgi:hypothetical protein